MANEVVNGYQDGAHVRLARREGGRRVEQTLVAEHVSYLLASEVGDDVDRKLKASANVRGMSREGDWVRVSWRDARVRDFMCQDNGSPLRSWGIRTFEGDVDPVTRHVVDVGVEVQAPRRAYLDLETDSRVPFSRKEEMRILSWAVVDDAGASCAAVLEEDSDGAERDLIGSLWEYLEACDQVVAWNGDGFDFPVLESRTEQRSLRVDPRRWLKLDHLVVFRRMNMHSAESGEEKRSMRLQSIATALLGEGKDDFDAAHTYEAWAAGGDERARLLRYNLTDTDLLRKIEAKTGYLDLFGTLCQACRVFGDSRGLNPTRQMDGFLLRLGRERGHHFPTKGYRKEAEQFKGAYVMEPLARGIERDVHVADFASLYPSIILTWNMSPDTLERVPPQGPVQEGACRSPLTGVGFSTGKTGILPAALGELLKLRKEWNDRKAAAVPGTVEWVDADRRSTAYKVAANSFYGVIGSTYSRYYDRQVAESVTQCGVWLIKETIEAAADRGWRVIYADTDSLFVQGCGKEEFGAFVKECNEVLYPERLRGEGCAENRIKLAYEKAFDRIVFSGKKRYVGRYAHYKGKAATADSKPEIKGLEYKRGDAALLACRLQQQVIELLMSGCEDVERFHLLVGRSRDHVLGDPLPVEEVMLSKALTKPLREYVVRKKGDGSNAGEVQHVAVARILAARGLDVTEGTRIEYVVADGSSSPARVIPASDYTGEQVDRFHVWESMVYPPSWRLLESAFPDVSWEAWADVRPRRRGRKVLEGQEDLFRPRGVEGRGALVVRVSEASDLEGVRGALSRHPGERAVRLIVMHPSAAEVELAVPVRVDGGSVLVAELRRFGGITVEES